MSLNMIDIEKAKKEFDDYVEKIETKHIRVQTKVGHMKRVANNCKKIAIDLQLNQDEINLAELIGLLHDIGRFEEYKKFTPDIKSEKNYKFDHGQAGVEVLKKDNYIRKYVKENEFDEIIYKAIYEHNKYALPQNLSKKEELFCKIVKDADKLDLIYEGAYIYWEEPERIKLVEEGELSSKMLEEFFQHRLANIKNKTSETDQILRFTSFVYDLNFAYSFRVLKENDNVSKMIDKFNYQKDKTKNDMLKVKKEANDYIQEKCR